MVTKELIPYSPVLVPALHRIQQQFGYLKTEALEQFSKESGVPLYRLQAVASFFPHFLLTPPRKVTLRVCRDLSCHLAGSGQVLRDLDACTSEDVAVEGTSCLGRCDRAPAACLSVQGGEHEQYYLARSCDELKEIVMTALKGAPPAPDHDADHVLAGDNSLIDPYQGNSPDYRAVRKAVEARDASLEAAIKLLSAKPEWTFGMLEKFRLAAIGQMRIDFEMEPAVREAVRCWQMETEWAKGRELGGWSDVLLDEIRDADLRGLGGAGIPAVQKWRDVRDAVRKARERESDDRAFIVVNGDESEPGTFKDRELLLRTPHLIVEAVILASLITEGHTRLHLHSP
jgi:NADH:ubiquinone oxidoreductase subunit E